jgi:hypothetical protein
VLIGLAFALVLLELIFQLLPVPDKIDRVPVNRAQPYAHLPKNSVLHHSLGWNFYQRTSKRINNYGYASDVDYSRGARPDLIVVGDSYVEAMQVANARTITGVLNSHAPGGAYNVAVSGAPLSQYLAFAGWSVSEFEPRALVFVVVGNDFDESLCDLRPHEGMHCVTLRDGADLELIPSRGDSTIRSLAKSSALLRYVVFNLGFNWRLPLGRLMPSEVADQRYVGNTSSDTDPERMAKSKAVVDYFLKELPGRAGDTPVIFVIDGMRPNLYSSETMAAARGSYFDLMREYFKDQAVRFGHEVIDMQSVFEDHYRTHGKRFEFPTDGHWNELAHDLAAQQVLASRTYQRVQGTKR